MFYTYVIQSVIDRSLYKGHCQDLTERIKQHNSGQTVSIKHKIPFELVYFEEFEYRDEAIKREKYFKSAAGRKFIKNKLTLNF